MIDLNMIILWFLIYVSLFIVIFWLLVFLDMGVNDRKLILKKYPFVSVAVPAYNEEKTVIGTLKSVLELDYPHDKLEVIVINDGSEDNTRNLVEEFISKNKDRNIVLINQKNKGKGAAINNALRKAGGSFFACLDSDSYIEKNALKKMLPFFYEDKRIATVLPFMKVRKPDNFLAKLQWCEYLINFFYKRIMGNLDCVHVAPGPFSVYRKEVLDKLGGFSENNLTEDMEISLRLQKHNYRIIQLINTSVYTIVPRTFKGFYKQRNRWYKGSLLNLFDYRKLIFNRKYGDFGMLQLPRTLFGGLIAILALTYVFMNYIFSPLIKFIHDFRFVEFNFFSRIGDYIEKFILLDMNFMNLFLVLVLLSISLVIIKMIYKYTNESVFDYGWISVVSYLALYGILASAVWCVVFAELIVGKKQKW